MSALELSELIKQHPDLPVIALVGGYRSQYDSFDRLMCGIGSCRVGEYCRYDGLAFYWRCDFEEAYYFANEDALCKRFGFRPNAYLTTSLADVERYKKDASWRALVNYLHSLSDRYFKKAILVDVDPLLDCDEVQNEEVEK